MGRPWIHSSKRVSDKDYSKRCREKNKKHWTTKREERKKISKYKKYICPKKYQELLKNVSIRAWQYRKSKKSKKHEDSSESTVTIPPPSWSPSSQNLSKIPSQQFHDQNAFNSKQPFQRSVNWTEIYLPNISRKKTEVLNNLTSKYQLRIKLPKSVLRKDSVSVKKKKNSW